MSCDETRQLIHAYLDKELDLVRSLEIERHLKDCEGCAVGFRKLRSLSYQLRGSSLNFRAPEGFEKKIHASLAGTSSKVEGPQFVAADSLRSRRTAWGWPWLWAGGVIAALTVLAVVITSVTPKFSQSSPQDLLAQEVVSSHIRSLMPNHLTDVTSSDQHTVKPWFDGRLDFSPTVVDLASQGFPLIGGRLDYLDGRAVAALVYQRRKHLINVFTWPSGASGADSSSPIQTTTRQGYNVFHWTKSGMVYWAVSDLNSRDLESFIRLLRDAT